MEKYIAKKTYTKNFKGVIHKGSFVYKADLKEDAPKDFFDGEIKIKKIVIVKEKKSEAVKKVEAEKVEAEKVEAEKVEAEKVEAEKVEAEKVEAEKVEGNKNRNFASFNNKKNGGSR